MKYKVGDKVRIRADLEIGCDYGRNVFTEEMESFKGKVATITKINARNEYIIDVDNGFWSWTDEMLEPVTECDFKVGDKVIIKPGRECSRPGVFTIVSTFIHEDKKYHMLDDSNTVGWDSSNFLKVPLFKKGDIVTFKDIEKDKWFSPGLMSNLEGCSGVIDEVKENYYRVDKQGQDSCEYTVRDTKTDSVWFVTSASIELVPTVASLESIIQYNSVLVRNDAELLAQAVDNVKGPQFKIGDVVVIRDDLVPGKNYIEWGGWNFLHDMAQHRGKVAKIIDYGCDDTNYLRLDIDDGRRSWITNSLLPYTPGSDYDLDKTLINKQQTKQNYENRLQEKGTVIAGRERQSGCAVRYPGEQIRVGISNLGYRKVTCKRQEGS